MLRESPEVLLSERPDRAIMLQPDLPEKDAARIATLAVQIARINAPKLSGLSSSRLTPIWREGMFGIYWPDKYVWFQDHGISPFTMKNLQGKTIPMWINDPTGTERQKNPKAKTRTTAAGVVQVLIFRKAAVIGSRITKTKRNPKTGQVTQVSVPASYPGAPGRIRVREASKPYTTEGKVGGRIASGNGGVRWRHPGLKPRLFINNGLTMACLRAGIIPVRIYVCDSASSVQRYQ